MTGINSYRCSEQSEAVVQRCSVKKVFLKIMQIYRKTPLLESFFNKVTSLGHRTFLKKETLAEVFSGEFCEIF